MLKKSSLQDHVSSLEILRDEVSSLALKIFHLKRAPEDNCNFFIQFQVQILSDKKRDLENRLSQACEERDALSVALEETVERVRVLERHTREQDSQIR